MVLISISTVYLTAAASILRCTEPPDFVGPKNRYYCLLYRPAPPKVAACELTDHVDGNVPNADLGAMYQRCRHCHAIHCAEEQTKDYKCHKQRFPLCCAHGKLKSVPEVPDPPLALQGFLLCHHTTRTNFQGIPPLLQRNVLFRFIWDES